MNQDYSIPQISIIIPVYNVEKYLRQCVDSVLVQTYADFELILVDDCSTDSSSAICDEYAATDSRVRVIHFANNSGVSAARNAGIDESKGKWITFIDSDDWVETTYIENFLIESDDSDLVIQGIEFYDERNSDFYKKISVENCTLSKIDLKNVVANNRLLSLGYPVAKAYSSNLIRNRFLFRTEISYHEDHIFVLEVMNACKQIRLVNSIAYKYRYFHSGASLSSKCHPWFEMKIASDGMIAALNAMHDDFLITGSEYEKEIYSFAYSPKINAVFDVFRNVNFSERKRVLDTLIISEELKSYYTPFLFKEKLVTFILLHTPYVVKQMFYWLYIKYQDRSIWR